MPDENRYRAPKGFSVYVRGKIYKPGQFLPKDERSFMVNFGVIDFIIPTENGTVIKTRTYRPTFAYGTKPDEIVNAYWDYYDYVYSRLMETP